MTGTKTGTPLTTGSHRWLASAVLNSTVLEPLYELNRSWLTLLAFAPRYWVVKVSHNRRPNPVPASLVILTPDQRAEIARCPFSLFTARFNDGAYWLGIAGNTAVHEPHPPEGDQALRASRVSFAELALFYAWHLARTNPPAARVVLGMADQTLAAFETLTLTDLQRLAFTNPELFAPRWPERSAFWLRLLESLPESPALVDIRLTGLQMLAAEMTSDQAPDLNTRRTTRP